MDCLFKVSKLLNYWKTKKWRQLQKRRWPHQNKDIIQSIIIPWCPTKHYCAFIKILLSFVTQLFWANWNFWLIIYCFQWPLFSGIRHAKRSFLSGSQIFAKKMSRQFIWKKSIYQGYKSPYKDVLIMNMMQLLII